MKSSIENDDLLEKAMCIKSKYLKAIELTNKSMKRLEEVLKSSSVCDDDEAKKLLKLAKISYKTELENAEKLKAEFNEIMDVLMKGTSVSGSSSSDSSSSEDCDVIIKRLIEVKSCRSIKVTESSNNCNAKQSDNSRCTRKTSCEEVSVQLFKMVSCILSEQPTCSLKKKKSSKSLICLEKDFVERLKTIADRLSKLLEDLPIESIANTINLLQEYLNKPQEGKPVMVSVSQQYEPEKCEPKKCEPEKFKLEKLIPEKIKIEKFIPEKCKSEKFITEKIKLENFIPEKCIPEKCEPKKCIPEKCEPQKCEPQKFKPEKCIPDKFEVKKCKSIVKKTTSKVISCPSLCKSVAIRDIYKSEELKNGCNNFTIDEEFSSDIDDYCFEEERCTNTGNTKSNCKSPRKESCKKKNKKLCREMCQIQCTLPPSSRNLRKKNPHRNDLIATLEKSLRDRPNQCTKDIIERAYTCESESNFDPCNLYPIEEPIVVPMYEYKNRKEHKKCLYAQDCPDDGTKRARCFLSPCQTRNDFRDVIGVEQLKILHPLLMEFEKCETRLTPRQLCSAVRKCKTHKKFTKDDARNLIDAWQVRSLMSSASSEKIKIDEYLYSIQHTTNYLNVFMNDKRLEQTLKLWESDPRAHETMCKIKFRKPRSVWAYPTKIGKDKVVVKAKVKSRFSSKCSKC